MMNEINKIIGDETHADDAASEHDGSEHDDRRRWDMLIAFLLAVEHKLFRHGRRAWCHRHQKYCRMWSAGSVSSTIAPGRRIFIAGVTCKDFSRINLHRR